MFLSRKNRSKLNVSLSWPDLVRRPHFAHSSLFYNAVKTFLITKLFLKKFAYFDANRKKKARRLSYT